MQPRIYSRTKAIVLAIPYSAEMCEPYNEIVTFHSTNKSFKRTNGLCQGIHHLLQHEIIGQPLSQILIHSRPFKTSTTASPTSFVLAFPPRSALLMPSPPRVEVSRTFRTASSIALAGLSSPSEYRRSMAALRIVPIGLAIPWPAMSGAEPWIGS